MLQLYSENRKSEVLNWGFTEQDMAAFLTMQYRMQSQHYAAYYPNAVHEIIMIEQCKAGRWIVDRGSDWFTLVDISILPAYQNRGIGTTLIEQLKEEAAQQVNVKGIRLSVLHTNRAVQLYERLGFVAQQTSDDVYKTMIFE